MKATQKTEMITLTLSAEDFDLPEGDWQASKAYVYYTDDGGGRVSVSFIRYLDHNA